MEVLSPSTRGYDAVLKLRKYFDAAVREYWLVDPEARTVMVYTKNEGGEMRFRLYKASETIVVGILPDLHIALQSIFPPEVENGPD